MPKSTICLSFDFDAMSVWFGYKNVTPAMLYRGEYGARVGVPRILELLKRYDIPATFFVPGHTIESFPEPTAAILEAGHEIGHHSYAHVDPSEQTPAEERADMERALACLARIGVKPLGYRSPSGGFSEVTISLIEEYGFLYDSSLMADDFQPYHPRMGDQVTKDSPHKPGFARTYPILNGYSGVVLERVLEAVPSPKFWTAMWFVFTFTDMVFFITVTRLITSILF